MEAQSETDSKFFSNMFGQKYVDTKKVEEISVRAPSKERPFVLKSIKKKGNYTTTSYI